MCRSLCDPSKPPPRVGNLFTVLPGTAVVAPRPEVLSGIKCGGSKCHKCTPFDAEHHSTTTGHNGEGLFDQVTDGPFLRPSALALQVANFSNEQALEQVRLYWINHLNVVAGSGVRTAGVGGVPPSAGPATAAAAAGGASNGSGRGAGPDASSEAGGPRHQRAPPHAHGVSGDRRNVAAAESSVSSASATAPPQPPDQAGQRQLRSNNATPPTARRAAPPPNVGDGGGGASGVSGDEGKEPPPGSAMKSCRLVAGTGGAVQERLPVHPVVPRSNEPGGGGGGGGGRNRRPTVAEKRREPLVQALHQIAQVSKRTEVMI